MTRTYEITVRVENRPKVIKVTAEDSEEARKKARTKYGSQNVLSVRPVQRAVPI